MHYRYLGNTGLKVSELSFGAMTFNGGHKKDIGGVDQLQANELTRHALDLGINMFDTADVYANGLSELMLGKALEGRRNEAIIATKVRFQMSDKPNDTGLSRHHIIQSCNESLIRLKTDHIDLYQIHSYDPGTPLEETLRALDELVKSGKVRYIGCSNLTAWQTMKALALSERLNLEKFVSSQLYYSIGVRDIEHELVPLCLDQKIGILCWSPLSGGFFSGKYSRDNLRPGNSRRSNREASSMKYWSLDESKGFEIIDALKPLCDKYKKSIAQLSLAWLLHQPAVSSVIIGANTPAQLTENANSSGIRFTPEELDMLNEIGAPPVMYPQSHQLTSDER